MKFIKSKTFAIVSGNIILPIYIGLMSLANIQAKLFELDVNISIILLIMYVLELSSTMTFQLRMKLTARYEIKQERKLMFIIPTIAGCSWLIAGLEGLLLINDSDTILKFLVKIPPVFIATFLGVLINLKGKKNEV